MSGEDAPQPRIAVIGGGYTGAAFVIHAVSARSGPLGIDVIEPAAAIGRGIAYSTTDPAHRINVPSAKMSLFPNDPEHLTRWLFSHGILPDPASTDAADHHFVPRYAYGDYVRDTLRETLEAAGERVRFRHHRARAEAVRRSEGGWVIALSDDGSIEADTVVICSGHAAPTPPPTVSADALRHPGFIQNPWADGAFAVIGPKDEILVVGTGLTMADVIASLDRMGHQGSVTALSRRGLLAQPHGLFLSDIDFLDGRPMPTTALELLRLARHQVRRLGPDIGWQAVVDALRFDLPRIWRALSAREQRKVARRLLPFWEVHRFRVAPQIHDLVSGERSRGRLRLAIGSFEGLQTRNGRLVAAIRPPRQDVQRRDYDHVVLCTGPGKRLETDRLLAALLADGLARPDAVALGLETDERSRVVRPDGTAWQSLIALGPLTRGSFGEMTGAPDIVQHIRSVVDTIANDGGPSSGG